MWEGVGDRTELQYVDPQSYGHQRCVFLVLLMLNRRPWRPTLLAFSTASYHQLVWSPNSTGGPEVPFCWVVAFPTTPCLQLTDFQSPPSYIIVQSPTQLPTQSLEWYVWSLSSGNNCHAVQRAFSSGASVYECTMGFFTLSHFFSPVRQRDFFS